MDKPYYEKIKAEKKSIGFDYQYYFFLYELLNLSEGEIGLEVKDDVHIEIGNKLILVQLKHTTQTYANGKLHNLAERDIDLWKTIHNWLCIIQDKNDGREKLIEQTGFIRNTIFQIVTNKKYSYRNTFLTNLSKFKKGKIQINDFENYLQNLYNNTKDPDDDDKKNKLKEYIKELKEVKNEILEPFLKKIEVETDFDNLIKKIQKRIKHFKIKDEHIELVFNCIDSNLRLKNYEDIKNKKRITITAKEFTKEFTRCFYIARSPDLPKRKRDYYKFPSNPEEQTFIKQLVDIEDFKPDAKSEIFRLTNQKLTMMNDMEDWIREGELMPTEEDEFDIDSINQWNNYFRKAKRESEEINNKKLLLPYQKEKKHKDLARECLEKVRTIPLKIGNNNLNSIQSNGQFYYLSDDIPRIGWLYNWDEKYKK